MSEQLIFPAATLGYRVWRVRDNQLWPLFRNKEPWQKITTFSCFHNHQEPAIDCSCGLHAFYSLEEAYQQVEDYYDLFNFYDNSFLIIGAVAISGQAQLHSRGLRAEKAQIIALLQSPSSGEDIEKVASELAVPLFDNHKEFLAYSKNIVAPLNKELIPQDASPYTSTQRVIHGLMFFTCGIFSWIMLMAIYLYFHNQDIKWAYVAMGVLSMAVFLIGSDHLLEKKRLGKEEKSY